MGQIIKEIFSPSNVYKIQVIKRKDGLFTTELFMWQEDCDMSFGVLLHKVCL